MKRYKLTILIASLFLALPAHAATTDFVTNGDVTVSGVVGNGVTADLTILSGSNAASTTFNGGTLTVTDPDTTSPLKVTSSDSNVLSIIINNSAGTRISCTDSNVGAYSSISLPIASETYTVVPSNARCYTEVPPSTGGGGSGGGTSRRNLASSTIPASPNPAPQALANTPAFVFARFLGIGSTGNDVKALQAKLATEGFFNHAVTGYFGPVTSAAVKAFQAKYGIDQVGYVGPMTRAQLNKSLTPASQTPTVQTGTPVITPVITPAPTTVNTQQNEALERLMKKLRERGVI